MIQVGHYKDQLTLKHLGVITKHWVAKSGSLFFLVSFLGGLRAVLFKGRGWTNLSSGFPWDIMVMIP